MPVAWLSLTGLSDDPVGFWGGVLEALKGVYPVTEPALAGLSVASGVTEAVEARLLSSLARLSVPTAIVLDDYHAIEDPAVSDSFLRLVRRGGPLHVVIVSRIDPAFPLHRLRLSGHVVEVVARELALTGPEVQLRAQADGLDVSAELADRIVARTEGWPAGVRLALMYIRRAGNSAVDLFAGADRTVAEYLAAEVLEANEPAVRDFLLRTSVCDRVNHDLSSAITGEVRSQAVLEGLESRNQFVMSLGPDRRWFRFHPLLREMLEHTLRRDDPDAWRAAHLSAADWYARNGEPLAALEHAQACDHDVFFSIFTAAAGPWVASARRPPIRRLLGSLPYPDLPSSVPAQLCAAGLSLTEGDLAGLSTHANRAQSMADGSEDPATRALLAFMVGTGQRYHGDYTGAVESGRAVLDAISAGDRYPAARDYRLLAGTLLGAGLLWSGDIDEAAEVLGRVARQGRPEAIEYSWLSARSQSAMAQAMLGRFAQATETATQLLAEAAASGLAALFVLRPAYWVLGTIPLLRADPDAATAPIAAGLAASFGGAEPIQLVALQIARAAAAVSRGDLTTARLVLDAIRTSTQVAELPVFLADEVSRLSAEITLLGATGGHWEPPPPPRNRAATATSHASQARMLLAASDFAAAGSAAARHRRYEALVAAHEAFEAATPDLLARPFLMTPGIEEVLQAVRDAAEWPSGFMLDVLGRLNQQGPNSQRPLEPLTERELTVLTELPTMKTNSEIADDLYVSVNTIKAHLKGIYRKLDVSDRREAVRRARESGLLH